MAGGEGARLPSRARRTVIGLERAGLGATAVVVCVVLLYLVALPAIASLLPDDAGVGGKARVLDPAATGGPRITSVRIVPASDWETEAGNEPGEGRLHIGNDGAQLAVTALGTTASAPALLERLRRAVVDDDEGARFSEAAAVQTYSGLVGLAQTFVMRDREGIVAAFSRGPTGILVHGSWLPGDTATSDAVTEMVRSIELAR
jgi:hypothetical protein